MEFYPKPLESHIGHNKIKNNKKSSNYYKKYKNNITNSKISCGVE